MGMRTPHRSLFRYGAIAAIGLLSSLAIGCGGDSNPVGPASGDGGGGDGATSGSTTSGGGDDGGGSATSPTGTTSAGGSDAGSTDALAAARTLCVKTINDYRATLGLKPYEEDASQDVCVDGQAKADSISMKAHSAFGKCSESAQNECPGWPGPPDTLITGCLKSMWAEGPGTDFSKHGHYINMSSTSYTKVACGFYQTADGSWWAAQDFY
jgi:hypothetical protein